MIDDKSSFVDNIKSLRKSLHLSDTDFPFKNLKKNKELSKEKFASFKNFKDTKKNNNNNEPHYHSS